APKVELGFWPGGDRDGNPYVTSETTVQVAQALRDSILGLYLRDIEALLGRLTFDGVIQPLQAIRERLKATRKDGKEPGSYGAPEELLRDLKALRRELAEDHQGLFMDRLDGFIHKVLGFGFHFAALDLRQDSRIHSAALEEIFSRMESGAPAALLAEMKDYGDLSPEAKFAFL